MTAYYGDGHMEEQTSITIRIPNPLRDALEAQAHEQHRTLSGQIRFFLEMSVSRNNTEQEAGNADAS
jgi:hypothetical protein